MSWGIRMGGSKAAVTDQIQRDTNLPPGLKSDLISQVGSLNLAPNQAVLVESNGHVDPNYGGNGVFRIDKLTLVVEATPAASPEPTAAPSA